MSFLLLHTYSTTHSYHSYCCPVNQRRSSDTSVAHHATTYRPLSFFLPRTHPPAILFLFPSTLLHSRLNVAVTLQPTCPPMTLLQPNRLSNFIHVTHATNQLLNDTVMSHLVLISYQLHDHNTRATNQLSEFTLMSRLLLISYPSTRHCPSLC